jgi:hypothetical protein
MPLGKYGHNFMSNIDAMKYKSRLSRKPKGIQRDFTAGTRVGPFTVDG